MVSAPLGWDHIWEDTLPHSEVNSPPSSTLHVSSQFEICSPGQWIPKTIWCLTNFYFTCLPTGTMFNQLCFNPTCRYRPFWPFIITRGICPHCFLRRGGVPKKRVGTNIDLRKRISSSSNSPRSVASGSVLQCSGHPATLPAHSVQRQDCPAQWIFSFKHFSSVCFVTCADLDSVSLSSTILWEEERPGSTQLWLTWSGGRARGLPSWTAGEATRQLDQGPLVWTGKASKIIQVERRRGKDDLIRPSGEVRCSLEKSDQMIYRSKRVHLTCLQAFSVSWKSFLKRGRCFDEKVSGHWPRWEGGSAGGRGPFPD